MNIELLARHAVDCGFKLHCALGPGLLESVYEAIMIRSLQKRGLGVESQKPVSFIYDSMEFIDAFRIDILVEGKLLIELKSVEKTAPVHAKQTLTYLRLMNLPLGLLINFGAATYKEGIHRIANSHLTRESAM